MCIMRRRLHAAACHLLHSYFSLLRCVFHVLSSSNVPWLHPLTWRQIPELLVRGEPWLWRGSDDKKGKSRSHHSRHTPQACRAANLATVSLPRPEPSRMIIYPLQFLQTCTTGFHIYILSVDFCYSKYFLSWMKYKFYINYISEIWTVVIHDM